MKSEIVYLKSLLKQIEQEILSERLITFNQIMNNKKISALQKNLESLYDDEKKSNIYAEIQILENSNFKNFDSKLYDIRNDIKLKIEILHMEICRRQFG